MSIETTCPDCRGRGHRFGFAGRAAGQVSCSTCRGIGALTLQRAELVALGARLRETRESRRLTIARAACVLSVHRADVLALEAGKCAVEALQSALAQLEKLPLWDAEKETAEENRIAELLECIAAGISPCCKTPLDTSRVFSYGRHKGHGPRLCATCGQEVYRQ